MKNIDFYFDFISPYAYLAWTQVHELAANYKRDVDAHPILFAALLDKYGHKGPAEIPPKRIYVFKDVIRSATVLNVKVAPPPAHPFNPLLALRCVALVDDRAQRKRAIDALFRAVWGGGKGVTDPAEVTRVLTEAGFDGADLVARASSDDAKARVKANTDRAMTVGAFGVPTLVVDGELFWGLDSFGHVERRLRGEDPIDRIDLSRFAKLPAQAERVTSKDR